MKNVLAIVPTLVEAMIWSTVCGAVAIAFVLLTDDPPFASRWTGACTGWTKPLAMQHAAADLSMFLAYMTIAIAIARLHPVMNRVRDSPTTVILTTIVFMSCAATHLADAITTFSPHYVAAGVLKAIAAMIAIVGCVFIAVDLRVARQIVRSDRQRLEDLEDRRRGA